MQANDVSFERWAAGHGPIQHEELTRTRVRALAARLAEQGVKGDGAGIFELLHAADRIAAAAMWLVVHETYALNVHLDGSDLAAADFKRAPEGHTGGSLNMVPAYVGYMAINALTGITRAWLMGQGHCVSAVDSVNLLLGNLTPAHASRYSASEAGLTNYVRDFYSYRMREDGSPDSPLGSHVNAHTAGGMAEGGYLGFAELQYVHMPLPGERLVVFLSDGAFEEQRGSDWAPRWWRAEDSGLVAPIMIHNGRRIDQRTTMSQSGGTAWFTRHLELNGFDPIVFDGRDPAAFVWAIFEMEDRLQAAASAIAQGLQSYPVRLPYGIAVAPKGAGFCGEGTNLAHNLPLGGNPRIDPTAAASFNTHARALHVPEADLVRAAGLFRRHAVSARPLERDHPMVWRSPVYQDAPQAASHPVPGNRADRAAWTFSCPMAAVDQAYVAAVRANPALRPRVGNPDEIKSNRMLETLGTLRFRVTDPEPGIHEAVDGAVISALNEEAVAAAAFGNKGGINIIVTYEAFATKMQGIARQEIIFSAHCLEAGRPAGWLSVPLVLTSHTWENSKNEQSHQDPSMAEAMLSEPSHISRVLFPPDANTAAAVMRGVYRTRGQVWTLVVPKAGAIPNLFSRAEAEELLEAGGMTLPWAGHRADQPRLVLAAAGAYQLVEILQASERLAACDIAHRVVCLLEPARLREPRSAAEAAHVIPQASIDGICPRDAAAFLLLTHTRPEPMDGILRPLTAGKKSSALGYINRGGTVSTPGLMYLNKCSWAHVVVSAARLLGLRREDLLQADEIAAMDGRTSPAGVIIERRISARPGAPR